MKKKPDPATPCSLPDAELDVMACLWKGEPMLVKELCAALAKTRPMSEGAMATLLKRLEAKHMVGREKASLGKAFRYYALRRPEPTYRTLVQDLLKRVFHGDGVRLMASLLEATPPTPKELDEMQRLLDTIKKREH